MWKTNCGKPTISMYTTHFTQTEPLTGRKSIDKEKQLRKLYEDLENNNDKIHELEEIIKLKDIEIQSKNAEIEWRDVVIQKKDDVIRKKIIEHYFDAATIMDLSVIIKESRKNLKLFSPK